jgi:hypothetical protein
LSPYIANQQTFGEIVQREDGNGNWMHLQYKTKVQAQMAMSQNGKVRMTSPSHPHF